MRPFAIQPKPTIVAIILFIGSFLPGHTKAQTTKDTDGTILMEYLQNQQFDMAIQYLQSRSQPGNKKQMAILGYTYYQAGRLPEAIQTYEQLLQLDSSSLTAHQYLGTIYLQKEQAPKAVPHYYQLTQLQPENAAYFKQLAFACYYSKMSDTAFYFLQKAYALNPADMKVSIRLAEEWFEKEAYPKVDSIINGCLTTDSLLTPAIVIAMKSAYQQKHYATVTNLGERLIRAENIHLIAYQYLAAAYYYTKQYKNCVAVNDFLEFRALRHPGILYYAALSLTELKRYEESNALLQTCIDLAKSKSLDEYYTSMSTNFEGLHQYKTAVAHLDTAFYLFHEPMRQYAIGRMYEVNLKNPQTAKTYYKRYLQLAKPEDKAEIAIYKYVKESMSKRPQPSTNKP
jgi:tetratricopeptide (TPR) repeat protein